MAAENERGFSITGREPWLWLGLATLGLHLLFNGGYGYFRDELYFIVCGERLAWGYVDQPPLIPLMVYVSHVLSGGSLTLFRLVPALAMSAAVAMTTLVTRDLGGGRFAQWLAGLCVFAAPVYLADGMFFVTDTPRPLMFLLASWCLIKLAKGGDERWWLAFGAIVGLALLTKYMIAFFLVGLAPGLLFTPLRRSFLRPWLYGGALIGLVIVLPNVLWQAAHGWPFLELGKAGASGKNLELSPLAFLGQQILLAGPLSALIWIAGLWGLSWRPALPAYRIFPIAYAVMFAVFVLSHGKATYLSAIYPVLFAGGAIFWERVLQRGVWRGAALGAIALAGAILAPLALPILPEERFIAYAAALGLGPSATASEHLTLGRLPQHFADMHGWPQMAAKVAKVYWSLPPAERKHAVFYGHNYGEAAAIDVFGRPLGLPPAISGHNNYFLWGLQGADGSVVIIIGGNREEMLTQFERVDQAGYIDAPYAMPYETEKPIYVLRGLKEPLEKAWTKDKNFS